jgi:putative intracellular protease/amidase
MPKALFILQQIGFNDNEYNAISTHLKNNNIQCIVASVNIGEVKGKYGQIFQAEETITNIDLKKYGTIILLGGENVSSLAENKNLIELLEKANSQNKLIVLLCMWPALLIGKVSFLRQKTLAVFKCKNNWSVETILGYNGNLSDSPIVQDHNILTCANEKDAKDCADGIIKIFKKSNISSTLHSSNK